MSLLKSIKSTLKLAKKTSLKEFKLYLKLCIIGIGIVGFIGFFIRLIVALIPFAR